LASGGGLCVSDALGCTIIPRITAWILPNRPYIRRKRDYSTSIKWLWILRSSRSHDHRCQPRSTEEQIIYPATGGNTYGNLAEAGVRAVTNQTRRLCWWDIHRVHRSWMMLCVEEVIRLSRLLTAQLRFLPQSRPEPKQLFLWEVLVILQEHPIMLGFDGPWSKLFISNCLS
jgi:hypothetical protein